MALVLALAPRTAWAHAVLFGSDPSPDAVLNAAPASVALTFSESVIPAGRGIKVFSPSGRQVAGPARVEGHLLTAPINSTETGTYVVTWQALASDTHPSRGGFRFVVGQPSANPYLPALSGGEIGTATPLGFALQALARWIHFLGVALAFGTVAYQLFTRREPRLRRLVAADARAGAEYIGIATDRSWAQQVAILEEDSGQWLFMKSQPAREFLRKEYDTDRALLVELGMAK